MWKTSDKELSDPEISLMLNRAHSGVVILDGPSGCGKTMIINTIENPSKLIATAELVSQCIAAADTANQYFTIVMKSKLDGYDVICLEDIDMMLSGKPTTTEEVQGIVKEKSGKSLIVITGIDIDKRIPGFAAAVEAEYYKFF